jgi:hypothetical protein
LEIYIPIKKEVSAVQKIVANADTPIALKSDGIVLLWINL